MEAKGQLLAGADGTLIPVVTTDPAQGMDLRKTREIAWKEARLVHVQEVGTAQPIFGATTGSVEQAGEQMAHCAARVGWGPHTRVHAVGDGAPWIANQIECVFGAQANYLIDFFHLCEYLAAASKSCSADPDEWYKTQKERVRTGKKEAVLEALAPHLEPSSVKDDNAPARLCDRYIRNHLDKFDYPAALQAGLPIGSGRTESAHRYVIQQRLKIPGAWWKQENADKMLALRISRVNGNWDTYWDSLKQNPPIPKSPNRQPSSPMASEP